MKECAMPSLNGEKMSKSKEETKKNHSAVSGWGLPPARSKKMYRRNGRV